MVSLNLVKTQLMFNLINKKSFLNKYKALFTYKCGQILQVSYFLPTRDGLKLRTFVGLLLAVKKSKFNSTFLLRNNYRISVIEYNFSFFVPSLFKISFVYTYRKKIRLAKLYFFRKLRQRHFQKRS